MPRYFFAKIAETAELWEREASASRDYSDIFGIKTSISCSTPLILAKRKLRAPRLAQGIQTFAIISSVSP